MGGGVSAGAQRCKACSTCNRKKHTSVPGQCRLNGRGRASPAGIKVARMSRKKSERTLKCIQIR